MNLETLWRGNRDLGNRPQVEKLLKSGKKLRIKLGIDPTGPALHIGRAIPLWRLKFLQDLGHQIVLIIGDFTATIGDASDKASERQPLNKDEIAANMADYAGQLAKVIDIQKAEILYNSQWLESLTAGELVGLAQHFTLAQMIERDNFINRYKAGKPIGLHEFLYPLLQGYDSAEVKADIEIGGTDQLFNLNAGRAIQKAFQQKPQEVLVYELLLGTDGRKMSTTWGNTVLITDAPADMYGKIMSIPDELIATYYEMCTDIDLDVIRSMVQDIAAGANPRDSKASLAREIVRLYHGEKAALDAEENFNLVFRSKGEPKDIPTVKVPLGSLDPRDLLVSLSAVKTRSEAARLIAQKGVSLNEEIISAGEVSVKEGDIIKVGKRRFYRIARG